jgi:HEAT repeat protein
LRQLGFHQDSKVLEILTEIFEDPEQRTLQSSAAYGLANQGSVGLERLLAVLDKPEDPRVRTVLYALRSKSKEPEIQRRLVQLLEHPQLFVRQEALEQLSDAGHEQAPGIARRWLRDFDFEKVPAARRTVFFAIVKDLRPEDLPELLRLAAAAGPLVLGRLEYFASREPGDANKLESMTVAGLRRFEDAVLRRSALRLLSKLPGSREALRAIRQTLKDEDPRVRVLALDSLAHRQDRDGLRLVERLRKDEDPLVRATALRAAHVLGRKDSRSWPRTLERACDDKDLGVALTALDLLEELRSPKGLKIAWKWMESPAWQKRSAAVAFARAVPDRDSIGRLIERLGDERGRVGYEAMAALGELTGKRFPKPEFWRRWWEAEKRKFRLPKELRKRAADDKPSGSGVVTFYGLPIDSTAVSFVIDVSGSMSSKTGTGEGIPKIDAAKRALQSVIKRCDPKLEFNLIWFQSTARSWETQLVKADKEARTRAQDFVRQMRAGGGTNVYEALEMAFKDPKVDTIYLLSDGAPSGGKINDVQELADEVRRWNRLRRIKIHGISIGADSVLLKRLAEESGGLYQRWV